jgi:glutamyl-tRNA reductase
MVLNRFVVIGMAPDSAAIIKKKKIEELLSSKKILGFVNLSTCLRNEYYLHLSEEFSMKELEKSFYEVETIIKMGREAVEYLFNVSCGIYSVIKGEEQILAQLKKSYEYSLKNGESSTIINVIFNKAIELGKSFRNKSQICSNALSLEAISFKFIKSEIEDLKNKKVLILGVGDLSRALLKVLIKEGIEDITITNRTIHKAIELKEIFDVKVISFAEKLEKIVESDVIISITSAPHTIIHKNELVGKLEDKKYFFLDLAVPRDIEEEISDFSNVTLKNLDDVWNVYHMNVGNREELIEQYSFMIERQIINLMKWFEYRERKRLENEERKNYNWE